MSIVITAHPDGTIEGLEEARAAILAHPTTRARVTAIISLCQKHPSKAAISTTSNTESSANEPTAASKKPKSKSPNSRKRTPKSTSPALVA